MLYYSTIPCIFNSNSIRTLLLKKTINIVAVSTLINMQYNLRNDDTMLQKIYNLQAIQEKSIKQEVVNGKNPSIYYSSIKIMHRKNKVNK